MPTKKIIKLATSINIAENLTDKKLADVSDKVLRNYEADKQSLESWMRKSKQTLELAEMKDCAVRSDGKSNFKSPLIARACIMFASNTIPEFIIDDKVAKGKVYGADPDEVKFDRGKRVTSLINYQLMNPNSDWCDTFGKSLTQLSCVGTVFRKVVWDDKKQSPVTYHLNYNEVIVHNDCKSLDEARSITHIQFVTYNNLVSNHRKGFYLEPPVEAEDGDDLVPETSDEVSVDAFRTDSHKILEQHCWLDLDDDGLEEPYIVVVHRSSGKILRIVARYTIDDVIYNEKDEVVEIVAEEYFTVMNCLYSFVGKLYGLGYGNILYGIQHTFDTAANQIIDAARLSNETTLLMDKSNNFKQRDMEIKTGKINIFDFGGMRPEDAIGQIKFNEPSPTLYQFLGYLDSFAKELSTTTDAMMGEGMKHNMKTGATNSMIERGMQVYNAIQKRIYKSLAKEFNIYFRLNEKNLTDEEYAIFLDEGPVSVKQDFSENDMDMLPVADPNLATQTKKVQSAELLLQLKDDPVIPPANRMEIIREAATLSGIENVDRFLPDMLQAQEDPMVVQLRQEAQQQLQQVQAQQEQIDVKMAELQLKSLKEERDTYEKEEKLEAQERENIRKHLREMIKMQDDKDIAEEKLNVERQKARKD